MTVWELVQCLSTCDPSSEVRVEVEGVSYGATPSVGIPRGGVKMGFDWNHGKVLITPECNL